MTDHDSSRDNWARGWRMPAESRIIERDGAAFFRQANATPPLLSIARAGGAWLQDESGRSYLDLYGNNCHHIGYGHPAVLAAAREQLDRVCFVPRGLTSEQPVALAESLQRHYPFAGSKVFLVPGGSEAVELALTLAKVHTGRYKTVSFWDAYHGRSAGALSAGGAPRDRSARIGPLMPGALHVPPFYWFARTAQPLPMSLQLSADRSLDALRALFECEPDIAAVLAEPIRNGPYVPPAGYWQAVRELCTAHGTALIFDEIPMGLGKTGSLFNSERVGVRPDITLIGKALGAAIVPLAAVIADQSFDDAPELNLGYYTHERNPYAAAIGQATLEVIVGERLPGRAKRLESLIGQRLAVLAQRHPLIAAFRCIGAHCCLDLVDPADAIAPPDAARRLQYALLERGVLAMPPKGGTLGLSAPLNLTDDELARAFEALDDALTALQGARP